MRTHMHSLALLISLASAGVAESAMLSPSSGESNNTLSKSVAAARNIQNSPWQNPIDPFDVNNDKVVSPLDALLVINELDRPSFSLCGNGLLPLTPLPVDAIYIDVSGNCRACR